MAVGFPLISSSTSTPVLLVSLRILATASSAAGFSTTSAPIFLAIARRCSFVSVANTVELPHAFATAIDINPIGPQPVTKAVRPAIGPASTVCTAFPSGSKIAP